MLGEAKGDEGGGDRGQAEAAGGFGGRVEA